jgi:predicted PurR-regulated permease PerM
MVLEQPGMRTIAIMALASAAFLLFGYFARHTFSALLTALTFAYFLNPILKYLEKRGFDRFTALVLLYGIGAFACFLASFLFIPYLGHQLNAFVNAFPLYVQNTQHAIEIWKTRLAPFYAGEEGAWLLERLEESLGTLSTEVSGKSYEHFKGLLFGIFDLLLSPILIFFILLYKEHVKNIIKRALPYQEKRRLIRLGRKINRTLEHFVQAMVLDCLLVGIIIAITLYLLDIEFAMLNGLFAGFASIVPFLGAVVAVIPAAFIGYAKSGDLTIIPKVCLAYFFINVLVEGNVIKPLIMKQTLRLNPLVVIFSVMAMGEMLGFWGIVLAIPLAALFRIMIHEVQDIFARDHAE